MIDQRGSSFFEILIALLVFVGTMMGLMTQQWLIVRSVHLMQADLNTLWEHDNQDERM